MCFMCLVHEFMNILRFMLCCELQLSRIGKKNFREYSFLFRTEKAIHIIIIGRESFSDKFFGFIGKKLYANRSR